MKNKYTFGDITFEIEGAFSQGVQDDCAVFKSDKALDFLLSFCYTELGTIPKPSSLHLINIRQKGNRYEDPSFFDARQLLFTQ